MKQYKTWVSRAYHEYVENKQAVPARRIRAQNPNTDILAMSIITNEQIEIP